MSDSLCLTPPVNGTAEGFVEAEEAIVLAARTNARVLVTGPDSLHSEDIARLIHHRSARAEEPFVHVKCADMTDQALEAELFGFNHDRAAAPVFAEAGVLRAVHGGTVLLSSVHTLSDRMQGLLSNWLVGAELRRHSEMRLQPGSVRLISETTRNLHEGLETGSFRADLYYRLNQIHVRVGSGDGCESAIADTFYL